MKFVMHLKPPGKSSPNQANVEEEDGQTNAGNAHLGFQMLSEKFLLNTNCVSIFCFEKVLTETSLPMGVRGTPPSYPEVSLLNAAAKFHVRDQV